MKQFRFRLARLERVRRQAERLARRTLGREMAALEELGRRQERIAESIRGCESDAVELVAARPFSAAMANGLRQVAARMWRARPALEARVEAAQRGWLEARREVRALELLRERDHGRWREERRRAEQNELDELARVCDRRRREQRPGRSVSEAAS